MTTYNTSNERIPDDILDVITQAYDTKIVELHNSFDDTFVPKQHISKHIREYTEAKSLALTVIEQALRKHISSHACFMYCVKFARLGTLDLSFSTFDFWYVRTLGTIYGSPTR